MSESRREKMLVLLVEDNSDRRKIFDSWVPDDTRLIWITNAASAIGVIEHDKHEIYAGVMLDFDLAEKPMWFPSEKRTGEDVARKLIEVFPKETPVLVHSMNPKERHKVVALLEAAEFPVTQIPFRDITKESFLNWLKTVREVYEDRMLN